jgi:hypothetical protein
MVDKLKSESIIKISRYSSSFKNERYTIREFDNFEYKNPLQQFKKIHIELSMSLDRDFLSLKGFDTSNELIKKIILEGALTDWQVELERLKEIKVSENLFKLLETEKKKEQIKLLKGLSLTSDELTAYIIKAHEIYGYTYSHYSATHFGSGFNESQFPELIHVENGIINTIGDTKLSKGQQKQIVEHRQCIIFKILDKGDKWHCFFITYKSLAGKEGYKNGQPHLHYISNSWKISRESIKEQLSNKIYTLPSLPHIDFYTHRNPK